MSDILNHFQDIKRREEAYEVWAIAMDEATAIAEYVKAKGMDYDEAKLYVGASYHHMSIVNPWIAEAAQLCCARVYDKVKEWLEDE